MKRIETRRMFKSFLSAKGISSLLTIAVIGLCLAFPVSKARMQQKGSGAGGRQRENQAVDQKASLPTRETVALPSKRYGAIQNGFAISHRLEKFDRSNHKPSAPNEIGVTRPVNLSTRDLALKGQAQVHFNGDGSNLRFYTIQSPGAVEMRVYFTHFNLPEGDEVYVYGTAPNSRVVGPYTSQGPFAASRNRTSNKVKETTGVSSDGGFWSGTIPGDTVVIEQYSKGESGSFEVTKVAHHYEAFIRLEKATQDNVQGNQPECSLADNCPKNPLSCHLDANCIDDPVISPLKDAVAKTVYVENNTCHRCSGTLIASNSDDFEPYFLTARHCVSTNDIAETMEFHWSYRSTYCNSGQEDVGTYTDGGAYVLSSEQSSDQTLLRIRKGIPSNALYAGWTTEDFDAVPIAYGLHHPRGSYLRWSVGTVPLWDTDEDCDESGLEDGYEVSWLAGTVESGSSGSGLFLPNGQLIGVLSCGNGNCAGNDGNGRYGKLRNFYDNIATFLELGDDGAASGAVLQAKPSFSFKDTLTTNSVASRVYGAEYYSKQYRFFGSAGQKVMITLRSDQFDTWLSLLSPVDRELLDDVNDGGGGTNSRITRTLPETGEYIIEASSYEPLATGEFTLSANLVCSFSLSSNEQGFPGTGGTSSFSVIGEEGCTPVIKSKPTWIDANYSSSDKKVHFQVAGNPDSTSRSGEIHIGPSPGYVAIWGSASGPKFKVTQAPCAVMLSTTSASFFRQGGQGSIPVSSTCGSWTVASQANWIKLVSGASGSGSNNVTYSVEPNISSSSRTGTISIADKVVTITQGGNVCSVTPIAFGQTINGQLYLNDCYSPLGPGLRLTDRYSFTGVAGQSIAVAMGSSALDSYLRLIAPNGEVIASNENLRGANARIPNLVGYLTLPASGTYIIEALASPSSAALLGNYSLSLELSCQYTLSKTSTAFRSPTGSGSFAVTTVGACAWTAKSNAPWITVTSSASVTGSGTVTFSVTQNTSTAARTGTITAAGQTFTVYQQGGGQ